MGLRPEHLEIVPDDTPGAVKAEVIVIEPTGSETMILVRRGNTQITAAFRERPPFGVGEWISLRAKPTNAHLFDAAGDAGRRLN